MLKLDRINLKIYFVFFIIFLTGLLIFFWSKDFSITPLEDTRMNRAHQFLHSIKPYFPDFRSWLKDLRKNGIYELSLGYFLPAPLMFSIGDVLGFRLSHITISLLTALLVFLILYCHFKYSYFTCITILLLLLSSYGFVFLSAYTILDQFAFFFFFAFVYYYFKNLIFLSGIFFLLAIFSKDPRVILASVPALALFIFLFDREKLKKRKNYYYFIFFSLVFLFFQSLSQGPSVDAFPFGFFKEKAPSYQNFFFYFGNFYWPHFYGLFLVAPVLVVLSVLGLSNLLKGKLKKIEKLLLMCFVFFILVYFSASTRGSHYIYFTFPFLAIFSGRLIQQFNLKHKLALVLLSGIILLFSTNRPLYFDKLRIREIEKLRKELLPYSNEGFILSHGFDWGRYFHNHRFANFWDWEWSGGLYKVEGLPYYVENNIGLVAIPIDLFSTFSGWDKAKDFRLVKVYKDWLFFIPLQNGTN